MDAKKHFGCVNNLAKKIYLALASRPKFRDIEKIKALFRFNDIFGKNPIILAFSPSRAKAAAFFLLLITALPVCS
ncbi:MAG: hypothetical protein HWQ41_26955 [Nostoc sp. NOS(2021)]|uniref:hypothetical protein n=1 Tax=Nostoc sp. NOS(2021) TaxID=2815407 RepID=UPI0025D9D59B|nr:hypothetical protein [Nostoc sp. NOS(2021)]MBN3898776.1 hypothetical protein [Nostoc sp. NOS(2021)]